MSITITRTVDGAANQPFVIENPDEKLRWRGCLPGASTWDRAAHTLRALQSDGVDAVALLPVALPASWMVNSRASSRAMQRWLTTPSVAAWSTVLDTIGFAMSPDEWLVLEAGRRELVTAAIQSLISAAEADGGSLAAVTKVLALLRPQLVPLMDDAALWFSCNLVAEPATADAPKAGASAFAPMLDWFAGQVLAGEAPLIALAAKHELAVLDAAQTLDRLLWMESWGNRVRARQSSD